MGKRLTDTQIQQAKDYDILFNDYKNIILNLFEWKGLPDGITSQMIEEDLFEKGCVGFANINNNSMKGVIALPCRPTGLRNILNQPIEYTLSGFGFVKNYSINDCAIIRNNITLQPTKEILEYYLKKLYQIDICKQLNIDALKTPFVIRVTDDSAKLSVLNYFNQIKAGEPCIIIDQSINANNSAEFLDSKVQSHLAELTQEYINIENLLHTKLGIDNVSISKAERLITAEAQANDELIQDNRTKALAERQAGAKRVNDKFGLHITVDFTGVVEETESKKIGG